VTLVGHSAAVAFALVLAGCAAGHAKRSTGGGAPSNPNATLQAAAETAVRDVGKAGAVVALEPDTGAVRAVYSVSGDRGDPLLVAHVPASTFKVFSAIAGLEAGALTATTEKECTGVFPFGGKELRCSKVHGRETTSQAITRSCNSFFYAVGAEIDHARVLDVARRFGFGSRTGIEMSDDPGSVPGDARNQEIKRDPANTMPLLDAIGHGEIEVTLLQLARAFAVIANGGKLVRLGLARGRGVERTVPIRPEDLALVRRALVDVVEADDGTAHAFAIPGFPYAGKTGSADAPPLNGVDTDEDAWFVAYAPPNDAKILVAARVERADVTRDAKLVVRRVLDAWRAAPP
jgi:cell division protein FtsI/penicillin-binding protein 2